MKRFVIGHQNPDTDSVVSAIAYAQINSGELIPLVAGPVNKETALILNKFEFAVPETATDINDDVILVDHNEESQIHQGVNKEKIVSIIDHHKLGGLSTECPITVSMAPVGSTSTVIAGQSFNQNLPVTPPVASILIAGIISDTLNLTSPTTTETDKKILSDLNKIAKLNIDELAEEMFAAKSDISDLSTEDLIGKDFKVFEMKNKKVGIGVWETVLPEKVMERKTEIEKLLEEKKQSEKLDLIFFAVVSILEQGAKMFVISEQEAFVAQKAFSKHPESGLVNLPGVVSRKKQIVPEIEKSV